MKRDVPPEVSSWMSSIAKIRTPGHTEALRKHIAEVNAAYTPEKRAAAARKRAETMRRKRGEKENPAR